MTDPGEMAEFFDQWPEAATSAESAPDRRKDGRMAKYGNEMDGHVEPHFDPDTKLCWCPCSECTSSLRICWCADCPCEGQSDHEAGAPEEVEWITTGPF
jgi:hypothetical protein